MSEYWKSTPKYWCKHCKTFVRDSKLEKQNHEATPKHQGNLQRFLRELHRNNERETREQQRGKDEVARLKGMMGDPTSSTSALPQKKTAASASNDPRQASASDRKRQLQQLAEMGIAVPEEARREMAMAGDWQVQSVTPVYDNRDTALKGEDLGETKAVGIHKRKFEGDEEKEEAGEKVVKRGWGSTTRAWASDDSNDLDALLNATKAIKQNRDEETGDVQPESSLIEAQSEAEPRTVHDKGLGVAAIKTEEDDGALKLTEESVHSQTPTEIGVKTEDDSRGAGVVFKKRKSKQTR